MSKPFPIATFQGCITGLKFDCEPVFFAGDDRPIRTFVAGQQQVILSTQLDMEAGMAESLLHKKFTWVLIDDDQVEDTPQSYRTQVAHWYSMYVKQRTELEGTRRSLRVAEARLAKLEDQLSRFVGDLPAHLLPESEGVCNRWD